MALRKAQHAGAWTVLAAATLLLSGCIGAPRPVAQAAQGGEAKEFHIYVSEAVPFSPREGIHVTALGFGLAEKGPFTVPGPEIRVREGDHVKVWLHDGAQFSGHTIHWHGLSVPWASDGVPYMTQTISKPGKPGVYLYEFDARETGTYWYHCHVDAPTHIDFGLFGAVVVEPRDPAQDPPFDREATVMLHELDGSMLAIAEATLFGTPPDKAVGNLRANPIDKAGSIADSARATGDIAAGFIVGGAAGHALGAATARDYYPEYSIRYRPHYDVFMMNGKSFPETEPLHITSGETLRIRLVNAGQLVHTMHLHGHHFLVTHKDGYPLPAGARYHADTLLIGPGERYDLYVQGNNPGMWDFHDHSGGHDIGAYAANDHAFPGGMNTMLVYEDFAGDMVGPVPEGASTGDYLRAAIASGLLPEPSLDAHAGHGAPPARAPVRPSAPGVPVDPVTGARLV